MVSMTLHICMIRFTLVMRVGIIWTICIMIHLNWICTCLGSLWCLFMFVSSYALVTFTWFNGCRVSRITRSMNPSHCTSTVTMSLVPVEAWAIASRQLEMHSSETSCWFYCIWLINLESSSWHTLSLNLCSEWQSWATIWAIITVRPRELQRGERSSMMEVSRKSGDFERPDTNSFLITRRIMSVTCA